MKNWLLAIKSLIGKINIFIAFYGTWYQWVFFLLINTRIGDQSLKIENSDLKIEKITGVMDL